ncbi:hypothetical protein PYR91_15655 [Sphaerisporangium sp. TRM90804]|nr:hypothetical protein [Sphaerisporangium sp. TRM90804]
MTVRGTADVGLSPHVLEEAVKLVELRDAVARLGLQTEIRESMPALVVHSPDMGLPVWVFVGYGGAYYSWQSAEKRHPVGDVAGAAMALAEYVMGRVF